MRGGERIGARSGASAEVEAKLAAQ
jgi:hypothetical protein